jgi:type I restriction enzyme S subunit
LSSLLQPPASLVEIKKPERYSLIGGPFGSKLVQKDYVSEGVPVIRGVNLPRESRFSFDEFVYVSPEKVERDLRTNLAFPGDIVVTQRGTLGQVGLIPRESAYDRFVLSQSQMKLTVDNSIADAEFVYYALRSPAGQHEIISRALTAGVPHINLAIFGEVRIPMPALPTQRKIAAILSEFDDLIENNKRRIKILEEVAQRIYREWFVDYRYPKHEAVAMVESVLGPVPDGWKVTTASAALEIDPRVDLPKDVAVPFVPMTSISESVSHISTVETRVDPSGSRFRNGDTLFARITPCLENGKTAYVQLLPVEGFAAGSTEFIVFRGRFVPPEYVYCLARSDPFRDHAIKSMSGATGRQRVRREAFDSFWLAVPPDGLLRIFTDLVKPLFRLSFSLFSENTNLAATRDLLLPRLISGHIDVGSLDIAVDESAA